MSVKVASNRFILSSLRAGFYQQIVRGISGFQELGERLVKEIEVAQTYRQDNRVIEIASILGNLPLKEHQLIGQYYKAWLGQKTGEDGRSIFERIAEESRTYKTRAFMSLAATEAHRDNYGDGFRYFTEALKTTDNPSLIVEVSRSIAVIKATEGFHPQSLKDLERIAPLLRYANPHARYQYYNSCAVELAEVGRLEEARNISNIVLASPYINAYPEWRETRVDIERKGYSSRSFVAITQEVTEVTRDNIVRLPERQNIPVSQDEPARVLHFMVKKDKNGETELPKDMSVADMMIMVMNLMSKEGNADEEKMRKLLEYATKLFSK